MSDLWINWRFIFWHVQLGPRGLRLLYNRHQREDWRGLFPPVWLYEGAGIFWIIFFLGCTLLLYGLI